MTNDRFGDYGSGAWRGERGHDWRAERNDERERMSRDWGESRTFGGREGARWRGDQDAYRQAEASGRYGYGQGQGRSEGQGYGAWDDQRERYGYGGRRFSSDFQRYGDDRRYARDLHDDEDRNWLERTGDRMASFFGKDDEHEHRADNRGKGPKGYRRSDERIREDVCDRLCDDAVLDASEIDVKVADRDVTLSGAVKTREDKRRAEMLAERASGVDNVQNLLRVQRQDTYFTGSRNTGAADTAGSTLGQNNPVADVTSGRA